MDEPVAAEDLHGVARGFDAIVADNGFRHGRMQMIQRLAGILVVRHAVNDHFGGLLDHLDIRQFVLDRLESVDRTAELHPVLGVFGAGLDGELQGADKRRQKGAAVPGQGLMGVFKSPADLAQQVTAAISRQTAKLTRRNLVKRVTDANGILLIVAPSIDEGLELINRFAPEHFELMVRDAAELRVKETDRVATTVAELRRLGAAIEARPDGFLVQGPTRLRGAPVDSHGDHRLAMALVVAGLVAEGETVVHDCGCIPDSFPGFEALLAGLGGRIAP